MFRVLVTDAIALGATRFDDAIVEDRAGIARAELLEVAAGYDALITRSRTQVDEGLLAAAGPRLKVVGRGGVGVDNIDLDAASRRGILVVNAPEANNVSAAELAIALLLAAARGVARSDARLRRGVWDRAFLGREVDGAALGIVGLGRIGSLVARRAQGSACGSPPTTPTSLPAAPRSSTCGSTTISMRCSARWASSPSTPR